MRPTSFNTSSADTSAMVQPAAFAAAHLEIKADASIIWELLVDVDRWNTWNPAVQRATRLGPVAPGTLILWKSQGITIRSTLHDVLPMRRLSWSGRAFGTQAVHAWDFEATASGVTVRTSESFDGWLPRLFRKSMQAKLEQALPDWLEALRQEAERRRR